MVAVLVVVLVVVVSVAVVVSVLLVVLTVASVMVVVVAAVGVRQSAVFSHKDVRSGLVRCKRSCALTLSAQIPTLSAPLGSALVLFVLLVSSCAKLAALLGTFSVSVVAVPAGHESS